MNKKLNIGVLGTSNIAKKYILDTLFSIDTLYNITGIASRTIENSKDLAAKYNATAYGDYESLIEEDSLDAIYIPLPNSLHYEWVKKSLNKGLHVIVEKSLACNLKDVQELVQLAKEKKLVLIENFQFIHHNQIKVIKSILEKNVLGEIRSFRASFGFPPFSDKNNIRYNKQLGGGALLDAAAYPIKISQVLLGNDLFVASSSLSYNDDFDVDIWGSGYLKQKSSKITSHIAFGFDNFYENSIEIWGSEGKLYTNRIFTAPPNFATEIILNTNKEGKEIIEIEPDNHFINAFNDFYKKTINSDELECDYNNILNQSRLLSEMKNNTDEK